MKVGFGVIGANSFVANAAVLPAIDAASNTTLVATASRSSDVPERWASTDTGSYEAVLGHPDVEAVYIPLPNGMHREWTEKAAAAGKHVLVEKPMASDSATARAMASTCADAGVILAEAWMTPFGRRYASALDVARSGQVGDVTHIDSRFTFTIGPGHEDNYRWDPDQGGGALLDVGIYCLGPVVDLYDSHPDEADARMVRTTRGPDSRLVARLAWADGRRAAIACSFIDDEAQTLTMTGADGIISVDREAFTGGADQPTFDVDVAGRPSQSITLSEANDPYRSMVEAFARAVRGEGEWPRPVERSIEMLQLIERIKDAARD